MLEYVSEGEPRETGGGPLSRRPSVEGHGPAPVAIGLLTVAGTWASWFQL